MAPPVPSFTLGSLTIAKSTTWELELKSAVGKSHDSSAEEASNCFPAPKMVREFGLWGLGLWACSCVRVGDR